MAIAVLACLYLSLEEAGGDVGQESTITATVRINPLEVRLLPERRVVGAGDSFMLLALVGNSGSELLQGLDVSLEFDPASCLFVQGSFHKSRLLRPHATALVAWRVEVIQRSQPCDSAVVMAKVTASDAATGEILTADSNALVIEISDQRGRGRHEAFGDLDQLLDPARLW